MSSKELNQNKELLEIKHNGKTYRYVFKSLKSIQAETANEIMMWYNDAKNRQKDVSLKEVQRSDLGEVKDAIVAHLVREVTEKKQMLPYNPDEAKTTIKEFMQDLPADNFSKVKDKIIKDFFFTQGKLHLATLILQDKPKSSLTTESILFLTQLMNSQNSIKSHEKKNSESHHSIMEN